MGPSGGDQPTYGTAIGSSGQPGMSTWGDYATALQTPTTNERLGAGIQRGFQTFGQSVAAGSQAPPISVSAIQSGQLPIEAAPPQFTQIPVQKQQLDLQALMRLFLG